MFDGKNLKRKCGSKIGVICRTKTGTGALTLNARHAFEEKETTCS